ASGGPTPGSWNTRANKKPRRSLRRTTNSRRAAPLVRCGIVGAGGAWTPRLYHLSLAWNLPRRQPPHRSPSGYTSAGSPPILGKATTRAQVPPTRSRMPTPGPGLGHISRRRDYRRGCQRALLRPADFPPSYTRAPRVKRKSARSVTDPASAPGAPSAPDPLRMASGVVTGRGGAGESRAAPAVCPRLGAPPPPDRECLQRARSRRSPDVDTRFDYPEPMPAGAGRPAPEAARGGEDESAGRRLARRRFDHQDVVPFRRDRAE